MERKIPEDMKSGNIHTTRLSGDIEILEYINSNRVLIKFINTGNTLWVSSVQVRRKNIKEIADMLVGVKHSTDNFGYLEIVEYKTAHKVLVRFLNTGCLVWTNSGQIRNKSVKDPMKPLYFGVGFLGVGRFKVSDYRDIHGAWTNMIRRCYCEKVSPKHPSYHACTVDPLWHNFQNFCEWALTNYKEGYHLDKDILVQGNKLYREDFCKFVPREINNFVTERGELRGEYPIGVHFCKIKEKFTAQCSSPYHGRHIGYFASAEEAHLAWAERKLEVLNCHIEGGVLDFDSEVKEALLNTYNTLVKEARDSLWK